MLPSKELWASEEAFTWGGVGYDKHFKRNDDDNNGPVQKWPQILLLLGCMFLKCVSTYQEEGFLHLLNLSCPCVSHGHWGTLANVPRADT